MRTATTPRAIRERGFTLLEMIVVLVLLGIASAAVFPAITSMLRSSTRATAVAGASGDGRAAERIIEHDIRSAAGARSKGNRSDLTDPRASVIQALNSTLPASHDILAATPTMLRFNTEAIRGNATRETVTLQLLQNSPTCGENGRDGRNWCITRTVQAGGVTTAEVLTRGRAAFPAAANLPVSPCDATSGTRQRLFCYRLAESSSYRWDAGWRPGGCRTRWTDLNSTLGGNGWIRNVDHNGFDPPVQIHQLDLITEVSVLVPTGGGFGSTSERTFTTTELTIRARQGEAYNQAIMCGAR